jgi:hypothetical protein
MWIWLQCESCHIKFLAVGFMTSILVNIVPTNIIFLYASSASIIMVCQNIKFTRLSWPSSSFISMLILSLVSVSKYHDFFFLQYVRCCTIWYDIKL